VNRKALAEGKLIHAHIIQTEFRADTYLETKLVILYCTCGNLVDGRRVLDRLSERNVVSWTAMIAAYARYGFVEEALALFHQMQQTGIQPDHFAFASVLPACANLAALEYGKELHDDIVRNGFQSDMFVGNALVDMYGKCGRALDARKVFNKMPERDVVSWTAVISGYAQNGGSDESLKLFRQMQCTNLRPNAVTVAGILSACSNLAALKQGKEIHKYIIRSWFQSDAFVGGALVDMYAKCGSIEYACKVFDKISEHDVVSWTAMIVGYAMHGYGKEAVQLFDKMQHTGTQPDHVTFLGVLSACCHAGLVENGLQYFDQMRQAYGIIPAMEHYCCIVDLLGRSGHLSEVQRFINKMPIKPNAAIWASLLGACRIHLNIALAEDVAERLFELEPTSSAHYLLLSNIYSAAGKWDHKRKVRKLMKDKQVTKRPGWSWIEVNNKVHAFKVKDRSHPQSQEIYAELERLSVQMEKVGYVPKTNFVLHDEED
jgi:pentatricopeptide repeat protein